MSADEWTITTLKEYVERVLVEKDKAINNALAAAEKAVSIAEANAEKWRNNANEWRGAMSDREKSFMSRSEFMAYKESTEKMMLAEKEKADITQGKGLGLHAGWGYLIGAIGLAATVWALVK